MGGHKRISAPNKRWKPMAIAPILGARGSCSRTDSYVNRPAMPITPKLMSDNIKANTVSKVMIHPSLISVMYHREKRIQSFWI